MQFLFLRPNGNPVFVREDAESATWTVEDMSLQCLFPYDAKKVIQRGQIIGFTDDTGVYQAFEIRKVRTYEPDHYQEVWAEHIAIAELTDEHFAAAEWTNITASAALTALLTGTTWSVGTDTSSGTSSADISMGSVWQDVRTIEKNWNVYITPRVVISASGITGRYLDIAPAQGTWRGIRLAIDKNMDEVGVTIDDTNLVTALYGYGRSVETNGVTAPLTFASVTWTATSGHPAKPQGQTYIEDTTATNNYGRNGRARFGFYQNSDISDPEVLLEKTWEALKASKAPTVTIDCMVRDLYRLGYADQPIRLHDTAQVEISPTGSKHKLEIIRLTVDLIDPTATRPTIGAYIPNIVYIDREISNHATGGGGGRGQTNTEYKIKEFETEISWNDYQINLRAYQRDMDNVEDILTQAGMEINSQGVLIYADDNANMVGAKFNVQAGQISSLVTKTGVNNLGQNDTLYSKITQTESDITTLVTKTGINSLGQNETLESQITQNASNITSLVTKTGVNSLGANETLYSEISQNASNITSLVTKTGVNSLGANETLYSKITQDEASITSLVTKTGINSLGANETLYSEIQQNATAITSKVSAGDISSTINQTAQSVLIQAAKINLSGYVTANQLSAEIATLQQSYSQTVDTSNLYVSSLASLNTVNVANNGSFTIFGHAATWQQEWVATSASTTNITYLDNTYQSHTISVATGTYGKYIYFLGRTVSS